jgi:DUF4097 and DUF4098 domain-containing protein YvlB
LTVLAAATLALTLAQSGTAHNQPPPQTDQTVPAQRGGRLTINNFAGEVVIHTWSNDTIHVVARHQSRTRVNIRPTTAGVGISASGTMGPAGSVDYDITAPAWMPIKVEGQFNFITIDGAQAEVSADSVRGDIIIKGGTGFVTAKSIEGEIVVEGARGKVNVSSVNQGITISDTSGEIVADSINGPITMKGIQSRSVDASTVNGNITYDGGLADGGRYSLTTHNGDVLMGVPENASATFTVRTYNGEFRTDLPLQGMSREDMHRGKRVSVTLGKGSADVNLESFGGTIRIRKGPLATSSRGRDKNL